MNVLVIGRGGREHAIARKLYESKRVDKVFVAPGNPGMTDVCELVSIEETNHEGLVAFAKEQAIALTVIGPETPLLNGLADDFAKEDLQVFGPNSRAAVIEGSKSFAKDLMKNYGIPTAEYETFSDYEEAKAYIKKMGAPIVIKADGLAAGKGVVVAMTEQEAMDAIHTMLVDAKFGKASAKVVIEEYLDGEEFSLMAFVNGDKVYPMAIAQDHKRAFDGDQGPNTGGMGAYSPVPQISDAMVQTAVETILKPTVQAMILEDREFTGILYAGLIATDKGIKVIEFNARFGDPETQVVLPRLKTDFVDTLEAVLAGEDLELEWHEEAVLGVVVAAKGYPGDYVKGAKIKGLERLQPDTHIYHAGVAKDHDGDFVTDGGRALLVAVKGADLACAKEHIYTELEHLAPEGLHWRTDIGYRAVDSMTIKRS